MSSQPSVALPSIGETFGACYIGSLMAAILYGISNLQVVLYYKRYPNDWWVYQYSVALLWVLDALHVAFSTHALYYYMITMFGNFNGLDRILWSMKLQWCLIIFLVVYVQWLYAIRIWKFTRHFYKILPSFVFLAVVSSTGTTIYAAYEIHLLPNLLALVVIPKSFYLFISTVTAADIVIAIMTCYYLHKSRTETMCSWLNSRPKHHSTNRATQSGISLVPVLRIPPHSSEGNVEETNISVSLQDIGSFTNKVDPLKEDPDCRV
ncbi:hypothetical protein ARMSODRAFT_1024307 [Armillaria solidipes]|uniref:Uncharacterized protein n=1 Tax=Armillaria solidipes TaxID=1076256 RepID=A0A2H3AZT1_9AGAR|nr:hypothetical protein ARMSODRAFT_1024307 [Armillaria solidipes]